MPSHLRVAVIGAGAFGGWTALHLRRLGVDVTLVDTWGAGNSRASSGGETRVIRAVYGADRIYVEMVGRSFAQWEALDPSLYVETGTLWMHRGDDAYVRSSAPLLEELGFPIDRLSVDAAARRWPQIDFTGVHAVWLEKRAGVLSARKACMSLRDTFVREGGTFRIAQIDPAKPELDADVYVYACGPWLGALFPEVPVRPTRQEVFFFGTPRGSQQYGPAQMPVWLDFGERIFYGMPDLDGRGFKLADDTRGEPFDPTNGDRRTSEEGLARARQLLKDRFPELATAPLLESRVCQYENSPDGHLILDRHPSMKNVWLAGGGSGHGFKLSPAVGELVAQAIVEGRELPRMFSLAEARKSATQFGQGEWDR
ncbi:MAG TPA: FAD-dependent oxidoreductase [Thermoanaerobaculia bacterium]